MRLTALAFALLIAAAPPATRAAESYDACVGTISSLPVVISTQGVWCLKGDLATAIASGNAITVDANNVTIDCNHFKLGGLAAGVGTEAHGVLSGRANTTVRRCHVRGFKRGIFLTAEGGGGHVVEDNRVEDSTRYGIVVGGDASVVRRNLVFDIGGGPASQLQDSAMIGIFASFDVDVLDNTVRGVTGAPGLAGHAIGIAHDSASSATIAGNRISAIVRSPTGLEEGIYAVSPNVAIRDNTVVTTQSTSAVAILCTLPGSVAYENIVLGPGTAVSGCHDGGTISPP